MAFASEKPIRCGATILIAGSRQNEDPAQVLPSGHLPEILSFISMARINRGSEQHTLPSC